MTNKQMFTVERSKVKVTRLTYLMPCRLDKYM